MYWNLGSFSSSSLAGHVPSPRSGSAMNPVEAEGMSLESYAVVVASAWATYFWPLGWGDTFLFVCERSSRRVLRRFVWDFLRRLRALLLGPGFAGLGSGWEGPDAAGEVGATVWSRRRFDGADGVGVELAGEVSNAASYSLFNAAGAGEEGREGDGDGDGELSGDVP